MMPLTSPATLLAFLTATSSAQTSSERVWSSFAFIFHGERTPLYGQVPPTLTPLGAQQLYSQGSYFRDRYLANSSSSADDDSLNSKPIVGINRDAINNHQLSIYSSTADYDVGSSLAFMQGLYPSNSQAFPYMDEGISTNQLANGSSINYPLDGYQYPNIQTLSVLDPSSIWLQGHMTCTNYLSSSVDWRIDPEMEQTYVATYDFYQNLWSKAFEGSPFDESAVNFASAYELWDYASYQYNHNSTVRGGDGNGTESGLLDDAEMTKLQQLANEQQYGLNGNLTAYALQPGDMIRAIAGRTLAGRVSAQFQAYLASPRRQRNRLNLMFGSFEPFLAFFALSNLADQHGSGLFMQIPPPGSAMVFELFGLGGDDDSAPADEDDLWVRFLYRNGTAGGELLREYPLFARPNAESAMRWSDFYRNMDGVAVSDPTTWCQLCDSPNPFCGSLVENPGSSSSDSSSSSNGDDGPALSPAAAGLIGAATTLAVLTLLSAGAWALAGVHIVRRRTGPGDDPSRRQQRTSSLGGFKGAEKMVSDHDISIARNGARHARIGSWELVGGGPLREPRPLPPAASAFPVDKDGATIFGASIRRGTSGVSGDTDVDSITGVLPLKPLESV